MYHISDYIINHNPDYTGVAARACYIYKNLQNLNPSGVALNFEGRSSIDFINEPFNEGVSVDKNLTPSQLYRKAFCMDRDRFDPLNSVKDALVKDWESTVESHNNKRRKAYAVGFGIIILFMTLVESSTPGIAA